MLKYYTGLNEERKQEDEKSLLAHANMKLDEILEFGGESYNELPMF